MANQYQPIVDEHGVPMCTRRCEQMEAGDYLTQGRCNLTGRYDLGGACMYALREMAYRIRSPEK